MLITFIIAIIAVAFLMVGLSITLMRKGRDLQGDVGSNDEMKKRGLKCTSQQIKEDQAALRGEQPDICEGDNCDSCGKTKC